MKHLKQEFDKQTFKDILMYSITMLTLTAGLVLLFLGLLLPPQGEIHDSVLTAFGFILLFVAAVFGVSLHYGNELNVFKQKVTDMLATGERNVTHATGKDENTD